MAFGDRKGDSVDLAVYSPAPVCVVRSRSFRQWLMLLDTDGVTMLKV